jgi:hypothetical protein
MFGRILQLQYNAYGAHDRRCFVTIEKINMVRSQGTNFEDAVEELRKTFSLPAADKPIPVKLTAPLQFDSREAKSPSKPGMPRQQMSPGTPVLKGKQPVKATNKIFKVMTSMRKKKNSIARSLQYSEM